MLDLGFLIDGSVNVGNEINFRQIIIFVLNMIKLFNISPYTTHVGLVISSMKPTIVFNFQTNIDIIIQTLMNIQFPGKYGPGSNVGHSLYVMKNLFIATGRRNVPRTLIIVTAGISTDDVITPASQLRLIRIDIFCVTLGSLNSEFQMQSIASLPHYEHVFSATFIQLGFIYQTIFTKILKGKVKLILYP